MEQNKAKLLIENWGEKTIAKEYDRAEVIRKSALDELFIRIYSSLIDSRNYLVRFFMLYPKIWWCVCNCFNKHFMCSVIGIIRDEQNRVLLLDHKYRPDPFFFPCGWLKRGESPLDGLLREVKEETNFDVVPKRLLSIGTSDTHSHIEFVVEAEIMNGDFRTSSEIRNFKWVEPSSLLEIIKGFGCSFNTIGELNEGNMVSSYSFHWK